MATSLHLLPPPEPFETVGFVLRAHATDGQQVEVHAERPGCKPANQWHPAGAEAVTLVLEKE